MLENLTYFLNGASLSFFAMGAFHMAIYARQSKSRPHYLFTICLIWMALIELKEFFLSHDAAYNYEILGPGFTFPDLFTLALLSLFFFELVMPGRITARYSLKLLSPFVLLGGAFAKEKGMAPQQWQESIRKSRTRGGEDNGLREITGLQEECP